MDIFVHNKRFMEKFDRFEPILQDHTAMNIFKTCDRKYFYRIVLGRVPYKDPNQTVLDFGSAGHKFYETLELAYQKCGNVNTAFGEALKVALAYPIAPPTIRKWEYLDQKKLAETLMSCFEHWKKEKSLGRFEVLGVEQPLNVGLPDGSITSGRMDQLVKWNGTLWIRDFKFTSKDKEAFQKGTDPNDQATRYIYMGSKLHGRNLEGIIFQCIINEPEGYTEKAKAKPTRIESIISQRTSKQLDQWEVEQVHVNRQLALDRELDIWPMKEHNCAWCPYANVCRRPNEGSQMAALEQGFKLSPWDHTKVEQG